MHPKVSIIVPVYNVEKYLVKCIDSILKQTLNDFELILVNDGSVDNSLKICKYYKSKDSRVKVIDKLNGGVSSARNAGLNKATGDYIGFVDPDDWISPVMFEKMLEAAKSNYAQLVICDYIEERKNFSTNIKINIGKSVLKKKDIIEYLIKPMLANEQVGVRNAVWGCVWRLLIKREIVANNNIVFDEKIPFMEDLIFTINTLAVVNKAVYLDNCYYYYLIREDSALNSFRANLLENNFYVYDKLLSIAELYGIKNELEERFNNRYINTITDGIFNESKWENKDKFNTKINNIKYLCKNKKVKYLLNNSNLEYISYKWRFILKLIIKEKGFMIYSIIKMNYLVIKFKKYRGFHVKK